MRYLLTSLLCVFTLSLTAQEAGCTYQQANNYSSTATVDDGTCVFFCSWQPDSNADGNVGVSDLLDFLLVFGDTDSDSDGVWDSEDECIDVSACNYQDNPTELCMYLDAIGVCGGDCNEDADGDGICDFVICGNPVSHEGYDYSTVQIGEQCWFSENCRYLPVVSPSSAGSETDPYYYVYGYEGTDVTASKATTNYATYGVLYNWPAVMTAGICPNGWHIPSDGEFTELTDFLGGESVAAGKMKEAGYTHWFSPNTGATNSSGFTSLPGGYSVPSFGSRGYIGYWWSSSETGSSPWMRRLLWLSDAVQRHLYCSDGGLSARCVRD